MCPVFGLARYLTRLKSSVCAGEEENLIGDGIFVIVIGCIMENSQEKNFNKC